MKNSLQKICAFVLMAGTLLVTSCEPEIEKIAVSKGELNLDKYVAVGNSLTAGFMDNGLYREGQESSYPNILAGQFKQVGGGNFAQPLFTPEQENGSGYLRLSGFSTTGSPILTPVTDKLAIRSQTPLLYTKFTEEVNNLGVPGIRMSDIQRPGYGSQLGNRFFERITTNPLQTYLERVAASNPTFFSCWLGNNDILGYATTGASADFITIPETFKANNNEIINVLTANGAKGIIATIPDVTGIPFFKTVSVSAVRAIAKQINQQLDVYIKIGPGVAEVRVAQDDDLILLTTQATIGRSDEIGGQSIPHGFHPANPLTDSEVLDSSEIKEIENYTKDFNTILKTKASEKNLAVFDAYTYFNSIQNGMMLNGVGYSPAFITGNLFSLDGVHLTPRGYAIVANEMIKAINAKYNSRIPTVDVTQYRAVLFP
ncbi:G-D-S-L family lipolytic protein [Adhaeribacter arboris]|uniref:G-D-S-L family lipolytic protein n=1 Tax=Adhaeribacter arboris TaxID=2072846 RepID=A0A2T2YFX7_9BACT|nr:SGNH/GDSL hydrolase family protein [Adhaeribacter arboris]PSR54404.1 G-D-S-L family lipolytic protein [Adhaeribacter arboris]